MVLETKVLRPADMRNVIQGLTKSTRIRRPPFKPRVFNVGQDVVSRRVQILLNLSRSQQLGLNAI